MGRTKKQSDSQVLIRAFEVISREGFDSFTFDQVGRKVGLSPAALVKRFKTKRRLALLSRNAKWDENLGLVAGSELEALKGLPGIYEFLKIIARSVDSKRLGEHARWLGTEATEPRSRKKVAAYFETTRHIFERLLKEALLAKDLKFEMPPARLAKTLEALIQGGIFQFAFLDQRSIEDHLKAHVEVLLNPYIK